MISTSLVVTFTSHHYFMSLRYFFTILRQRIQKFSPLKRGLLEAPAGLLEDLRYLPLFVIVLVSRRDLDECE